MLRRPTDEELNDNQLLDSKSSSRAAKVGESGGDDGESADDGESRDDGESGDDESSAVDEFPESADGHSNPAASKDRRAKVGGASLKSADEDAVLLLPAAVVATNGANGVSKRNGVVGESGDDGESGGDTDSESGDDGESRGDESSGEDESSAGADGHSNPAASKDSEHWRISVAVANGADSAGLIQTVSPRAVPGVQNGFISERNGVVREPSGEENSGGDERRASGDETTVADESRASGDRGRTSVVVEGGGESLDHAHSVSPRGVSDTQRSSPKNVSDAQSSPAQSVPVVQHSFPRGAPAGDDGSVCSGRTSESPRLHGVAAKEHELDKIGVHDGEVSTPTENPLEVSTCRRASVSSRSTKSLDALQQHNTFEKRNRDEPSETSSTHSSESPNISDSPPHSLERRPRKERDELESSENSEQKQHESRATAFRGSVSSTSSDNVDARSSAKSSPMEEKDEKTPDHGRRPHRATSASADPDEDGGVSHASSPSPVDRRRSTSARFQNDLRRVVDMGFSEAQADMALTYCQWRSVEQAVEFLLRQPPNDPDHRFKPFALPSGGRSSGGARLEHSEERVVCVICGNEEGFHIAVSTDEASDEESVQAVAKPRWNLDEMEISDDPIIAQRQRQAQFKLRMAQQRAALQEAKAASEDDEKLGKEDPDADSDANSDGPDGGGGGGPTKLCEVCLEDKAQSEFLNKFARCGHEYCRECMKQHYRVMINDAHVLDLRCINVICNRRIKEDEILDLCDDDEALLEKYHKFKRNALLARNPNCRWCPRPGCDTAITSGSSRRPKIECPTCAKEFCFNCNNDWHEGQKCDQALDEKYDSWATGKDVQLCPRCKARIQKTAGCNHITCLSCYYQFCWLCRGKYRSDIHFAPWNFLGCPGRQFAYENLSTRGRPGKVLRTGWRMLVFIAVLVFGSIALGFGAVALGVFIAFGTVCCPCIFYWKRRNEKRALEMSYLQNGPSAGTDLDPFDRRHRRRAPSSEAFPWDDDPLGGNDMLRRHERNRGPPRGFGDFRMEGADETVEFDGVLHVRVDNGRLMDLETYERSQFLDMVEKMGFPRGAAQKAYEHFGQPNVSLAVGWLLEHPEVVEEETLNPTEVVLPTRAVFVAPPPLPQPPEQQPPPMPIARHRGPYTEHPQPPPRRPHRRHSHLDERRTRRTAAAGAPNSSRRRPRPRSSSSTRHAQLAAMERTDESLLFQLRRDDELSPSMRAYLARHESRGGGGSRRHSQRHSLRRPNSSRRLLDERESKHFGGGGGTESAESTTRSSAAAVRPSRGSSSRHRIDRIPTYSSSHDERRTPTAAAAAVTASVRRRLELGDPSSSATDSELELSLNSDNEFGASGRAKGLRSDAGRERRQDEKIEMASSSDESESESERERESVAIDIPAGDESAAVAKDEEER